MTTNRCLDCGKEIDPRAKRCKPCAIINNRTIRRPKEHKCLDCGIDICRVAVRCLNCAAVFNGKILHEKAVKRKELWRCVDCGDKISRRAKRCVKCSNIHNAPERKLPRMKECHDMNLNEAIDREATFERFGYYPEQLSPQSERNVIAVCCDCGESRVIAKAWGSVRCYDCSRIHTGKIQQERFKDYIPPEPEKKYCLDCGTEIFGFYAMRCCSCSRTGVLHRSYGKPLPEQHRINIGLANRGRVSPNVRGENNWAWKGGITTITSIIRSSSAMKVWIQDIFRRDNYTCQECHSRGAKLNAHHIIPFSKIFGDFLMINKEYDVVKDKSILQELAKKYTPFFDTDNGITLCYNCHKEFHALFGKHDYENRGLYNNKEINT